MPTPFSTPQTGRGTIAIAVGGYRLFLRLSEPMDRPEWLGDKRFMEQTRRNEFPVDFRAAPKDALQPFTEDDSLELLPARRVPVATVHTVHEVLTSGHSARQGSGFMQGIGHG